MKNILMASAAVLALASTAHADNGFQGFYAGVNGGYATGKADLGINAAAAGILGAPIPAAGITSPLAGSGFTGGFQAGYNHQFGSFVLGAELGFNFSNVNFDAPVIGAAALRTAKKENEFLAAARAGFVLNGWMPYAKAGWSNAKFSSGNLSKRLNGFLVGAGVETVLSNNIMVGAEWSTVKYKDLPIAAGVGVTGIRTQEFKVRLGYKF